MILPRMNARWLAMVGLSAAGTGIAFAALRRYIACVVVDRHRL
jgi:hypothetical protein